MTLSVALATFHKDRNIMDTIESVYDWVDEISLVYGSPEDERIAELRAYDTQKKIFILLTDNPPMFHINKQKAIDRCTKDWILQLDSDEVVSPALRREIENTVAQHSESDPVAYWIPRLNHFLGAPLRKGGQYPDKTIRLYKRGVAHLPCVSVHEQVTVDGPVGELVSDLLHFPYPTFEVYLKKWSRYVALEEAQSIERGVKPSWSAGFSYMFVKPAVWFLKAYVRHRGYVDGFPGFVFALFSALRYWPEYIGLYERAHGKKNVGGQTQSHQRTKNRRKSQS